jgi:DNA-3-methyladenine glycosylase
MTPPAIALRAKLLAINPNSGLDLIRKRRGNRPEPELTNGPAKVCQALGVTGANNGDIIGGDKFVLLPPKLDFKIKISATKRIGIKKDTHRLWRFVTSNQK